MRLLHQRTRGRVSGLLALSLLIAWPAAAAKPSPLEIDWARGAACPKPASLATDVERLLGTEHGQLAPMKFAARVAALEPEGYELNLDVVTRDHRAHRTVRLSTCEEVGEAAALLIATALDPAVALREEPATEPAPRERVPPTWALSVSGLFDTRSLPHESFGVSGGVQLAFERGAWLWAEGRYLAPARQIDEGSSSETKIDMLGGALGTAWMWKLGKAALGPALELEAGLLRGRSNGLVQAERADALWVDALGGALLSYALHTRVGLSLGMLGGVPLTRPRFALRDEEPFYTTRAWTFRLALGVRVSLGSR